MHLLSGREDVSYPNLGGAKAPLVAQRRLNISTKVPAAGHLNRSLLFGAYPFSTTPCVHIHAHAVCFVLPADFQLPHVGRTLAAPVMLRLFNT